MPPCLGEEIDEMLWDYQPDSFLESLKNNDEFYDQKTQKDLDNQIIKGLDIQLVPIDLEWCIQIALENNYNIQIPSSAAFVSAICVNCILGYFSIIFSIKILYS